VKTPFHHDFTKVQESLPKSSLIVVWCNSFTYHPTPGFPQERIEDLRPDGPSKTRDSGLKDCGNDNNLD
jgi:hypothetical protein